MFDIKDIMLDMWFKRLSRWWIFHGNRKELCVFTAKYEFGSNSMTEYLV